MRAKVCRPGLPCDPLYRTEALNGRPEPDSFANVYDNYMLLGHLHHRMAMRQGLDHSHQ